MPTLNNNLVISRCPYCAVANPNLSKVHQLDTRDHIGTYHRYWFIYSCGSCGGLVTASAHKPGEEVQEIYPETQSVSDDIPDRAREFLQQALESINAPSGAVMLAASSVDAMLKQKGLKDGSLYERIEIAAKDHLITEDMAKWAHDVRLDANDQRHADESAVLPGQEDAKRAIAFTKALAEFLFVLPAKVQRGIKETTDN